MKAIGGAGPTGIFNIKAPVNLAPQRLLEELNQNPAHFGWLAELGGAVVEFDEIITPPL